MRLIIASMGQAALCALSFLYLAVFGAWAEHLPWRLVFPIGLGVLWLLVTFAIVRRARTKVPFVLIAVIELPFAFGWPAWLLLEIFFGHF